jgi:hypothetical protein
LPESEFFKSHLRLDGFNLDFLGLYVCEALENITSAGRDKAVPHYGQRRLVGRRLNGGTEISNTNFETLEIHFLGSYMSEVFQNMILRRTNGAV